MTQTKGRPHTHVGDWITGGNNRSYLATYKTLNASSVHDRLGCDDTRCPCHSWNCENAR